MREGGSPCWSWELKGDGCGRTGNSERVAEQCQGWRDWGHTMDDSLALSTLQQGEHLEKQIHLPTHPRTGRELMGLLGMAPGMSPTLTWNVGVKVATCGLGASGEAQECLLLSVPPSRLSSCAPGCWICPGL